MVPPLPHARECKVVQRNGDCAGCRLRRSPGLAGFTDHNRIVDGGPQPSHGKRTAAVACERNIRLTVARRRRLHTVFPITKSAVNGRGGARCGLLGSATESRRVQVNKKRSRFFPTKSRAADLQPSFPRSAALERPARAIPSGKRSPVNRRGGTSLFAAARPGRHIRRPG